MTRWAKEKLLMIDPIKWCLSYEVIDNNIGMKFYVAKLIVSPNDDGKNGCKMEWSFVCDPIEGLRFEDFLLNTIETGLQSMAKKMEDALLSTR